MDSLSLLSIALEQQLQKIQLDEQHNSIIVLQAQIEINQFSPLAWLKAQAVYPQFYLHTRDSQHKILAIGELENFSQLENAQQFIQQSGFPLVGGLTFHRQAYFYLPRLLLKQQQNKLSVCLFMKTANWQQEIFLADKLIKSLEKSPPLLPLEQSIQLIGQKANLQEWTNWVEKALAVIRSGKLSKVVLANETQFATSSPLNPMDFLAQSEEYHQGCYHFLWAQDPEQYFVGSSPERLYLRQQDKLFSEALAGTAPIGSDERQNQTQGNWLLQDEKNVYENSLVAQGIRQYLEPYSVEIQIGELHLRRLRQLQHLQRLILAKLKPETQDQDCLNAIHPSAAVSGLDKLNAMQFLAETENFDRGWYAGTLGIIEPGYAEFCVTIRSALIDAQKISVFAGAGIVEGSDPLLEWQEIERKAAGLVSLLTQNNK